MTLLLIVCIRNLYSHSLGSHADVHMNIFLISHHVAYTASPYLGTYVWDSQLWLSKVDYVDFLS